jgi:hypothetical protein
VAKRLFDEVYQHSFDVLYYWFSDDDGLRLLSNYPPPESSELKLLLEAARRATWDAKHGPNHLRSGRFFITASLRAHASDKLTATSSAQPPTNSVVAPSGRLTRR